MRSTRVKPKVKRLMRLDKAQKILAAVVAAGRRLEEVALRLNVSIHSVERWAAGKNSPMTCHMAPLLAFLKEIDPKSAEALS